MSIRLQQSWPPFSSYWSLMLTITEDSRDQEFPLTLRQGRVLSRALRLLVRQYERLTAGEGEPS